MSKVVKTIEKLITATESGGMNWETLSEFSDTKLIKEVDRLIKKNKYEDDYIVERDNCYITKSNGIAFLFVSIVSSDIIYEDIEYLVLAVQPTSDKEFTELNVPGSEQSHLFRLKNIVLRQIKGVDKALDDFLDGIF